MLISSWKEKGGFSIYVDRFRKFLKLEDKYPEFYLLKDNTNLSEGGNIA